MLEEPAFSRGAMAGAGATPGKRCSCGGVRARMCDRLHPSERTSQIPVATEEPIQATVAGRYASALFELARDANQLAETDAGLTAFQRMLDESGDLGRLVRSPVFAAEEQTRALSAVLDKAGIGGLPRNFLLLIARNRRLFAAGDMIKAFRAILARHRGEVTAEVVSAHPLSDAQVADLKRELQSTAGKGVQLVTRVDPSILGGLIVKIGSRMVDSSLKTKLTNLKIAMNEVR